MSNMKEGHRSHSLTKVGNGTDVSSKCLDDKNEKRNIVTAFNLLKKLICIALSILHLVGIMGGYWLFCGVQQLHYKTLAQRLDTDSYAGSQAITIKLPVDETYHSNKNNYERVD